MRDARVATFEILYDVISNDAYSNIAVNKGVSGLNERDRAFATRLVYGVIERKLTLEYIVNKYLEGRTKPKVKIILLLGTYQLYFTSNVTSAAAVNESVKLCDKAGCSYYKGLVNAVLHKIDNNRIDIDKIENPELRYSCPQSLINMWEKHYSKEKTYEILESLNSEPSVFAVPNALFVSAEELVYELLSENIESELTGDIVRINSTFNLKTCKAFQRGLFHIEDRSSYLCAKSLEAKSGDVVLDVCSAPGGKAFTVAERMNNSGTVYAFDLYEHRVKLIKDGAKRLGIENIVANVNDASVYSDNIPKADRILCDVPCSGFGVIRRKPEIRYKNLDSVKELPEIQYNILYVSSKYLKKNGRIIYSTCTLNKKENEKVVEKFISENKNFKLIKEKTIFPTQEGGDGFYFAVMEKIYD